MTGQKQNNTIKSINSNQSQNQNFSLLTIEMARCEKYVNVKDRQTGTLWKRKDSQDATDLAQSYTCEICSGSRTLCCGE